MSKSSGKVVPVSDDTEESDENCLPAVGLVWDAIPVATKPKVKSTPQATVVDVSTMRMAAYVKKRQDMKDRIVKEVLDAALPDVSFINKLLLLLFSPRTSLTGCRYVLDVFTQSADFDLDDVVLSAETTLGQGENNHFFILFLLDSYNSILFRSFLYVVVQAEPKLG